MYPLGTHCSLAERALNCGGIGRDDQGLEALRGRNRHESGEFGKDVPRDQRGPPSWEIP